MTAIPLANGTAAAGVVLLDSVSGTPTQIGGTQQVTPPLDETYIGTISSAGTALKQYIGNWNSFTLEFSATAGSHSIIVEGNTTGLDVDQWYAMSGYPLDIASTGVVATRPVSTGYSAYVYPKRFPWIRVRVSAYGASGTITARVTVSEASVSSEPYVTTITGMANNNNPATTGGPSPYIVSVGGITRPSNSITDVSGLTTALSFASGTQVLTLPYSAPEVTWQYSCPVGGIVSSSTAVVVKTAAGAGVRNYLTSLTLATDTLGTATEFVVLDGSTVIYRTKLLTTAMPVQQIVFPVPLRGTANTSMSIQTVTASTGGVYCSASGYVAP